MNADPRSRCWKCRVEPVTPPTRLCQGCRRPTPPRPEYTAWSSMKQRCFNPRIGPEKWARYGGRGITVCDRWRKSFAAFLADVGLRPSPEHSLDRIDPDGNYEPGNVRWATAREQRLNQRRRRTGGAT